MRVASFVPTRSGRDLQSVNRKYDAHVRVEDDGSPDPVLVIDVFDASQPTASAHVESQRWEWEYGGRDPNLTEANDFLKGYDFAERIRLRNSHYPRS